MNSKALNLLGLAKRARKVVSGDQLIPAIQNKSAKLVLVAGDASENPKKKICDKCSFYEREVIIVDSSAELNHAMGTANRMAVGIVDEGFAKSLSDCLKG